MSILWNNTRNLTITSNPLYSGPQSSAYTHEILRQPLLLKINWLSDGKMRNPKSRFKNMWRLIQRLNTILLKDFFKAKQLKLKNHFASPICSSKITCSIRGGGKNWRKWRGESNWTKLEKNTQKSPNNLKSKSPN